MKPFSGSGTMRCIALISGCSLHQKQDLLAFGSIVQNLICLLSLDHEIFYRLLNSFAIRAKTESFEHKLTHLRTDTYVFSDPKRLTLIGLKKVQN
jgi:hypothetical protein